MANTLAEATYRLARELGIVTEGVATGGSATTLIDTNDLTQADDYWNGASLWILRDSAEAAAAPEGEFGIVSDFVASTDTLSLRNVAAGSGNALTAAAAAGDRYALGKKRYPMHILIQKVNQALVEMGTMPITDTTTLDTASAQTEYTLPIAANMDLREVYYQTVTGDANDNRWRKILNWHVQRSAIGSADLLMLPMQYPSVRDVKLVYMDTHPSLDDHDDKISEHVHLSRVVMEATVLALLWRKQKVGAGDPTLNEQLNFYLGAETGGLSRLDKVRQKYPIRAPTAHRRFLVMGQRIAEDEFYTPPAP